MTPSLDRDRLASLLAREEGHFRALHPRSVELHERARASLLGGVPMVWMVRWAGRVPLFVAEAAGARIRDVDGHEYVDLCLGDTGAMAGHSPPATVAAIGRAAAQGITTMLPTEDAIWVGEELTRRFGLPSWQLTLTATDANRFAVRIARHVTRRPKILVFDGCYHGTLDESLVTLRPDGSAASRRGSIGPPLDPDLTTRVVEWNDLGALEAALAHGDVAAVLAEPVLTNVGIVHPDAGYHLALRELTRRAGTLLIIDETHTLCAGQGGYTAAFGLEPDMLTIGKTIAGGLPAGAYGMSEAVARTLQSGADEDQADVGGIGGTLAGNGLSSAAIRATLGEVLTPAAFQRMTSLAVRWEAGVADAIAEAGLPWHVTRLGCRAEYGFRPQPPRTGAEASAADDPLLARYLHLFALDRGVLLTPFHNMALMSPATTEADVDRHTQVFREALATLI